MCFIAPTPPKQSIIEHTQNKLSYIHSNTHIISQLHCLEWHAIYRISMPSPPPHNFSYYICMDWADATASGRQKWAQHQRTTCVVFCGVQASNEDACLELEESQSAFRACDFAHCHFLSIRTNIICVFTVSFHFLLLNICCQQFQHGGVVRAVYVKYCTVWLSSRLYVCDCVVYVGTILHWLWNGIYFSAVFTFHCTLAQIDCAAASSFFSRVRNTVIICATHTHTHTHTSKYI